MSKHCWDLDGHIAMACNVTISTHCHAMRCYVTNYILSVIQIQHLVQCFGPYFGSLSMLT
jgi:hypothetical protein